MIIYRRITDYQKYQIKQFRVGGGNGNPSNYTPPDYLKLDNTVKVKSGITIDNDKQKEIIDAFLSASANNNTTDYFMIKKNTNLYNSLLLVNDIFKRNINDIENWFNLTEKSECDFVIAGLNAYYKMLEDKRKQQDREDKQNQRETNKQQQAEIAATNLDVYYKTLPEHRKGAKPKGYLATDDINSLTYVRIKDYTPKTDEQRWAAVNYLDKMHLTVESVMPEDIPCFIRPDMRFDSDNAFDYKMALFMLERKIITSDLILAALKNAQEPEFIVNKFKRYLNFGHFRCMPSTHAPEYANTDEYNERTVEYATDTYNNMFIMRAADKVGDRYKTSIDLFANSGHPSNKQLFTNAMDNFYYMVFKSSSRAIVDIGLVFKYLHNDEIEKIRENAPRGRAYFEATPDGIRYFNVNGEEAFFAWDKTDNDTAKLVKTVGMWYYVRHWENMDFKEFMEILDEDLANHYISERIKGTTKDLFKIYSSTFCFAESHDKFQKNFFINYFEACEEEAILGWGSDGYFHFKKNYGTYSYHLHDFIKPYPESPILLDYIYLYDEKTKGYTKKAMYDIDSATFIM